MVVPPRGASQRRAQHKERFWPQDHAWGGAAEKGWFSSPRTLPLLLNLISSKALSGRKDPSRVYLELLSRHYDSGVIEMAQELEHAYASGYTGSRALRTWQERMHLLEKNGFIKTQKIGNQQFKFVFIMHPTVSVQKLKEQGKVPNDWWNAYCARQIETKEPDYATLKKVMNLGSQQSTSKKKRP